MNTETLWQKLFIGIMFIAFVAFWAWVPNFMLTESECRQQSQSAITTWLCSDEKNESLANR